jgi:hypothetical protein
MNVPATEKTLIERLQRLYDTGAKHDRYQNLPAFVQEALGFNTDIDENWRGDTARYSLLEQCLSLENGERLCDIGANTGFFTLSLAHRFPGAHVTAYEMNAQHVAYIREIAAHFGMNNVDVLEQGVDLQHAGAVTPCDVLLHFNVLHHAGVDFDKGHIAGPGQFPAYAVDYLSRLSRNVRTMIFQMGYNWGGNKLQPLVPLQDDLQKLSYTLDLFRASGWQILGIAHCSRRDGPLAYHWMPAGLVADLENAAASNTVSHAAEDYLQSVDPSALSEFYRRPFFRVERRKEA